MESEQTTLHNLQEWKLSIPVFTGMSLNVLNPKLQPDAGTDTSVFTNTQINLLMTEEIQQIMQSTSRRMAKSRCKYKEFSRMRDAIPSDTPSSREQTRSEEDLHLESSREDLNIGELPTLQQSVKDPSNGPCAWKNWPGNQLGHRTRTCAKFPVGFLSIVIGS